MRTEKANIQYKTLLGYEKNSDGEMAVNAEPAETVRKLYELYLSGQTLRNIKETLETGGFKNTAGTTEWTTSNLRTIIKLNIGSYTGLKRSIGRMIFPVELFFFQRCEK